MSDGVPLVKLGEVLRSITRPEPVDPERPYRLLGAHWYAGGLYVKDIKPGSQIQANQLYRVEQGDFVYNRLFAWKGSFAVATEDNHECYVSNEFPCFAINTERIEPRYLWRYFSRASIWEEALGLSSGGTPTSRNRLKEARLLSMSIPLPPINEQRRIVARIEELAARIEEARGLRRQTSEDITAFVSSLHLSLAGTRTVRIREILKLHECRKDVQFGQKYPQVGIKSFGHGLYAKEAVEATQTTYKAFNRLYEGAVVLSQVKGWEGAISVCRAEFAGMCVSPEYRTFRCISEMAIPEYLAILVASPWFWTQL